MRRGTINNPQLRTLTAQERPGYAVVNATPGVHHSMLLRYAFYLLVLSIPFEDITVEYVSAGLFTISRLLGYVVLLLTLARPQVYYGRRPRGIWLLAGYFGVYLLYSFTQVGLSPSLFTGSFTLIQLLAFFLISFNLLSSERIANGTLWCLLISCTALALLQALGFTSEVIAQDRVSALGENANTLAAVLSLGLLALIGLSFGRRNPRLISRVAFIVCPAVMVLVIAQTGSRGGAAALVAGLPPFLLSRDRIAANKIKVVAVLTILVVLIGIISFQIESVRVRWEATFALGDTAGRDQIFSTSWEMFKERPLFGWGPATHLQELGRRLGLPTRDPHNLYLWVLQEVGLAGAIFFFLWLCRCGQAAWKARLGPQGTLPLSMFMWLIVMNISGTFLYSKFFWLVAAYIFASAVIPNVSWPAFQRRQTWTGQPQLVKNSLA
jgi:O-antigen ligase